MRSSIVGIAAACLCLVLINGARGAGPVTISGTVRDLDAKLLDTAELNRIRDLDKLSTFSKAEYQSQFEVVATARGRQTGVTGSFDPDTATFSITLTPDRDFDPTNNRVDITLSFLNVLSPVVLNGLAIEKQSLVVSMPLNKCEPEACESCRRPRCRRR
ncbi:MAG: hypothetical protein K8T25_09800 [Planctomycetia bacterium]|nr:hypothetical protein [Planctomycetia bacterium]